MWSPHNLGQIVNDIPADLYHIRSGSGRIPGQDYPILMLLYVVGGDPASACFTDGVVGKWRTGLAAMHRYAVKERLLVAAPAPTHDIHASTEVDLTSMHLRERVLACSFSSHQ